MTGALLVVPAECPRIPTCGSRSRLRTDASPIPRRPEVRADRAVARRRTSERRSGTRDAVEADCGGRRRYRIGEVFSGHGPEPLSRGFTVERLTERLARRARSKTLLLDQSFIAGVGNIYAGRGAVAGPAAPAPSGGHAGRRRCAAPASVHPHRPAAGDCEPRQQLQRLREHRRQPGDNAERLMVYRRTDEPCYRCDGRSGASSSPSAAPTSPACASRSR